MKFIRATREGNWLLHLSSLKSRLPWFFAADRVDYSRYASVYWFKMNALKETHWLNTLLNWLNSIPYLRLNKIYVSIWYLQLDAAENVKNHWTVQRQKRYGFSSIACDQAIEQTANRDSKTKGGLIGFTLKKKGC